MADVRILKYFAEGQWSTSATDHYMDVYDPSRGTIIARAPCCTADEVNLAVRSAGLDGAAVYRYRQYTRHQGIIADTPHSYALR
jgi:acyl-CoA reductase-like NAD-dependent aldehyde dehydrogenase